jgi:hypothetical protein
MMPRWKTAAWAIALAMVAGPTSLAAQGRSPEDAESALSETMTELTERLELTSDQATEMRPLLETQNTRSRAMMTEARESGQGRAAMSGMRERMQELRTQTHEEISALLDETQKAEYEKYLAERPVRGRRGGRGPAPGRDGP